MGPFPLPPPIPGLLDDAKDFAEDKLRDLGEMLGIIDVDAEAINEIVASIRAHADEIDAAEPLTVSHLGASGSGRTLEHHADLAHAHVTSAMMAMVSELGGIGDILLRYVDVQQENDAAAQAGFDRLNDRLERRGG